MSAKKFVKFTCYEVVYNACHGGFGLSYKAVQALISNLEFLERRQDAQTIKEIVDKYGEEEGSYWVGKVVCRHDPALVAVVKDLGEEAHGECADLDVVEIYSKFYRIENHDGYEKVVCGDDDWNDASNLSLKNNCL